MLLRIPTYCIERSQRRIHLRNSGGSFSAKSGVCQSCPDQGDTLEMAVGRCPCIDDFEPTHHYRAAAQQGVDLYADRTDAAFQVHRNQQSIRILNFRFVGADPLPGSGKFLPFDFKLECVNRQSVHLLPFGFDLNICDYLTARFPVAAHPTAITQFFVTHCETGTETNSGNGSGPNQC